MLVKTIKDRILFLLLLCPVCLAGCAHKNAPSIDEIEQKEKKYEQISTSKTLRVVPEHYVGIRRIPIKDASAPILHTHVTLRSKGSLQDIADMIMELVPVTVNIAGDQDVGGTSGGLGNKNAAPVTDQNLGVPLEALLRADVSLIPGDFPKALNINYDGRLVGLLNQVASQSGYGWDFSRKQNTITFARTMVRTFVLTAATGKVSYNNQLTNKSRDSSSSSGSLGSNVNSTVTTGDTASQTTQTYKSELSFDIWADTLKTVEGMLSSIGKASGNQGAGIITVRDRPENIRQITAFIDDVNARYTKQVALKVNVYSLEMADESSAGLDLQFIFNNAGASIAAGSLSNFGTIGTTSATIVSGKLKDSGAVLKALRQWGNARQITSSGIVAMNNQPAPVEAIKRIAFLAGSNIETTDYGQTTELTPGEVTTGFSMTVTPHILRGRRVILQYNVRLSALDTMEEFSSGESRIQLPQVSTRAFSQRAGIMMGQTLVLAGFQQATQTEDTSGGLLSFGKKASYSKTLLVITIEVENATSEIAQEASLSPGMHLFKYGRAA